jgi:hypothetical protein
MRFARTAWTDTSVSRRHRLRRNIGSTCCGNLNVITCLCGRAYSSAWRRVLSGHLRREAVYLLSSRPARRLGNVSYGIYLLQGLVTTLVLRRIRSERSRWARPPNTGLRWSPAQLFSYLYLQ